MKYRLIKAGLMLTCFAMNLHCAYSQGLPPRIRFEGTIIGTGLNKQLIPMPSTVIPGVSGQIQPPPTSRLGAIPSQIPLVLDAQPKGGSIEVEKLSIKPLDQWENAKHHFTGGQFVQLRESIDKLTTTWIDLTNGNGSDVKILEDAKKVQSELLSAYSKVSLENNDQRREFVSLFADNYQLGKALYDRGSVYRPADYPQIYANSRWVVAVRRKAGAQVYCSGFMISRRLVLTAGHCLKDKLPEDLEIVFNYELNLDSSLMQSVTASVKRFVYRPAAMPEGEVPTIDFAALELTEEASTSSSQILCLATPRAAREDGLYVIGHPLGKPKSVADNSYVIFPFQATDDEFTTIRLLAEKELEKQPEEDRNRQLQDLDASYRKIVLASGQVTYEYWPTRWKKQPTIGIVSDTFEGNSGSPAFSRESHRVIGILYNGQPDYREPFVPGWRRHEALVPISKVIAEMDKNIPNWKSDFGICVR